MILLNPGPVNLSDRVRNAMLQPDLCHREPEFTELQNTIRSGLLAVYSLSSEDWAAVLMTGSGTAAMEAMISSLAPDKGRLLVIENGIYGERLSRIAEIYHLDHQRLSLAWGDEIQPDELARELDSKPEVTHVALVHHETTTGRLNQLDNLRACCSERGITLLLDGVSSFGAEEIKFDDWNVGACAATANKCLHGVPGTSFVIVRRNLLPSPDSPKRNLYLDLESYCRSQDQGGTPFTQSVQTFYALAEALSELEQQGGWHQRRLHYRELMKQVRDGLEAYGIKPLLPAEDSSCVLNSFELPAATSYEEFHDYLKEAGFIIYAGQGALLHSMFRVSTMGKISSEDMARFLAAVKNFTESR